MMTNYPITPPPELVQQWMDDLYDEPGQFVSSDDKALATRAAQWGADQELEACCEWFKKEGWNSCHPEALFAARRPKPQTLNSIALQMLATIEKMDVVIPEITDTIRRALEAFDE